MLSLLVFAEPPLLPVRRRVSRRAGGAAIWCSVAGDGAGRVPGVGVGGRGALVGAVPGPGHRLVAGRAARRLSPGHGVAAVSVERGSAGRGARGVGRRSSRWWPWRDRIGGHDGGGSTRRIGGGTTQALRGRAGGAPAASSSWRTARAVVGVSSSVGAGDQRGRLPRTLVPALYVLRRRCGCGPGCRSSAWRAARSRSPHLLLRRVASARFRPRRSRLGVRARAGKWLAANLLVTVLGLYFVHGLAIILFYLGAGR